MRTEVAQLLDHATSEPELEDGSTRSFRCRWCRAHCTADVDLEPAPLCDTCAHEAVSVFALELQRVYGVLDALPLVVKTPILQAIQTASAETGRAFIERVIDQTTKQVLARGGHRGKRRK